MIKSDIIHRVDERELRLLQLLYAGYEDARAARAMGLSHRTVQRHVKALMLRLGVNSRLALGARAQELGWLDPARDRTDAQPSEASRAQQAGRRDAA
ncbi:LuxR C-terminal-related transcriptional regulator [Streptomyces sp. BE230]|uniref:LuxR C-terminal-related transcriptional regulator n=1 Tax=Streptomyces sp. BE230 TaxID=3002526 RepID=UPI002ED544A6|nr:LuxR C-terminal-related transcriptional regulator [Streptomyces sp. BE230]